MDVDDDCNAFVITRSLKLESTELQGENDLAEGKIFTLAVLEKEETLKPTEDVIETDVLIGENVKMEERDEASSNNNLLQEMVVDELKIGVGKLLQDSVGHENPREGAPRRRKEIPKQRKMMEERKRTKLMRIMRVKLIFSRIFFLTVFSLLAPTMERIF